jgi:hypothetical protein
VAKKTFSPENYWNFGFLAKNKEFYINRVNGWRRKPFRQKIIGTSAFWRKIKKAVVYIRKK